MAATRRARGDTQQRILEFIESEVASKGYPPSVREIGDAVGLKSTSTVHGHLRRLEARYEATCHGGAHGAHRA